ncbi:LpqB family beta-propeller domain-containing protein [Brachybacterium huguangmaarense]
MHDAPRPVARRAVLRAGAAGALAVGASACATIPRSGPISSVPIGSPQEGGAPYVQPLPPADDATPAQIVAGFVLAGVGVHDDFTVARAYLTDDARESWDPTASVTVYAGDRGIDTEASGAAGVRLSVQALTQVDAHGVRADLSAPSMREIDVPLRQVDGQWRIASPPAGIFLSQQAFDILFAPGVVHFLDARGDGLVPDVRWVLSQGQGEYLLERLAGGPVPWLADAVRTAVPEDLATAHAVVTTAADGVVQVELPPSVARLPLERRGLALAQIAATLGSLPLLGSVRLVSQGAELAPPTGPGAPAPSPPGSRAYGAGARGVVSLTETGADGSPLQLVPALTPTAVADPALSEREGLAAALDPGRTSMLLAAPDAQAVVRRVDVGARLAPPSMDDAGLAWTAAADGGAELLALSVHGGDGDRRLPAPWLAGREVLSIDLAPDGVRLLVVSTAEGAARVDQCAIARDGEGMPIGVSDPVEILAGPSRPAAATWYDTAAVLVLAGGADGEALARLVDLRTGVESIPSPPSGTTRLAGTAASGAFWASDEQGALARIVDGTWRALELSATAPRFR